MAHEHIPSSPLITLEPDPFFPARDLSESNGSMLRYYLEHDAGFEGYTRQLAPYHEHIHYLASWSMKAMGIDTERTILNYESFRNGFASFALISIAVGTRPFNKTLAARQVNKLYLGESKPFHPELTGTYRLFNEPEPTYRPLEEFAGVKLAERLEKLKEERPELFKTVCLVGELKHEDEKALNSRLAGVQVAFDLERPEIEIPNQDYTTPDINIG